MDYKDLSNIPRFVRDLVWREDEEASVSTRMLRRIARTVHMVLRDMANGQLTLRSMGLVYTTLLSIVPLLAVSFSVLKGFGVHNQLEPVLQRVLYPLGVKAPEITARIVEFVENVKVGLLGFVGLGLLIYTVISLLHKVESAFNETWRIREQRGIGKRFTDYLSVLLVGPVLVFSALGLTASLMNSAIAQRLLAFESFAWLVDSAGRLFPIVLVVCAFTFVYVFLPNTRVRLRPAFIGAVVAGLMWESAGWGFAAFVASSKSTSAIYSSFAILVTFMIWLYVSWLILLLGSSVAFYVQRPEYLGLSNKQPRISARMRERIGFQAMVSATRRHFRGESPASASILSENMGVPLDPVQEILDMLCKDGFLIAVSSDETSGYVPARDPALIRLDELYDCLRRMEESEFLSFDQIAPDSSVEELLGELERQRQPVLGDKTLRELLSAESSARDVVASGVGLSDNEESVELASSRVSPVRLHRLPPSE